MQKITYENYANGLSATFSNDNPRAFLAAFDGSSTPCTAIAYKPAEFDGQRFVSANLDARTIAFTVEWYGVSDGKFSIQKSYEMWEEFQRVFVPGQMGKLTWTNGYKTRFIECRAAETPNFSRVCGCKLSAEFKLIADYPYWLGDEHSESFENQSVIIQNYNLTNTCGLSVPFVFHSTVSYFGIVLWEPALGGRNMLYIDGSAPSGELVIDTKKCIATIGGELANQYLEPRSEFFKIPPGDVTIRTIYLGDGSISAGTKISWRDHYLGVS